MNLRLDYLSLLVRGCACVDLVTAVLVIFDNKMYMYTANVHVANLRYPPAIGLHDVMVMMMMMMMMTVGIFSIDDGGGSEIITLKRHSHCFKHCRVYSNLLKMLTVMEFH